MTIRYQELFAREYVTAQAFRAALNEMSRRCRGRRLTEWRCDLSAGLHLISFGSMQWILWAEDPDHIKMKMDGFCIPSAMNDVPALPELEKWKGMDLDSISLREGNEPAVTLSLVDSLTDPGVEYGFEILIFPASDGRPPEERTVPFFARLQQISEKRIPMTKDSFLRRYRDLRTGEAYASVTGPDGAIRIPPVYNDIELSSKDHEIYRVSLRQHVPSGEDYDLFGVSDAAGREMVPCIYPDLYCMANGFYLVMDYKYHWWVLNEKDEVLFGPGRDGVDIYSHNREYLYYIEYNEKGGCEALGIYSIALKTRLTPADYTSIRYLGDHRFIAQRIIDLFNVKRQYIDEYGTVLPDPENPDPET